MVESNTVLGEMSVYPSSQVYLSNLNTQFIRFTLQNRKDKSIPFFVQIIEKVSKWFVQKGFLQQILILEQGLYNEIPFISIDDANVLLKDKARRLLFKLVNNFKETPLNAELPSNLSGINKFIEILLDLQVTMGKNQNRLIALTNANKCISEQRYLPPAIKDEIENIYRIQTESVSSQQPDKETLEFLSLAANPFEYAT